MGYYVTYTLYVTPPTKKKAVFAYIEEKRERDPDFCYGVLEDQPVKECYDPEVDLFDVSGEFPDVLLELHRDGDEREDYEIVYILNGHLQRKKIEIIYPEFDLKTHKYGQFLNDKIETLICVGYPEHIAAMIRYYLELPLMLNAIK